MKRSDLIKRVSARTQVPLEDVTVVLEAAFEDIIVAISNDEEVAIRRFGTFKRGAVRGNTRPDPNSGRLVTFPTMHTVRWRPSKLFRDRVQ